jgi:small subunit ribosomal protein S17
MTADKRIRKISGIVVSDKPAKTIIVKVASRKIHPKYHKQYTVSKRYFADPGDSECHVGDRVEIEESRPLSKRKKWKVVKKVK